MSENSPNPARMFSCTPVRDQARGQFITVYMALITLVQGFAAAYLLETANRISVLAWPPDWFLTIQFLFSGLMIYLVWQEYVTWMMSLRWVLGTLDSVIPFVFAIVEFYCINNIGKPNWVFWVLAFTGVSVFAYVNLFLKTFASVERIFGHAEERNSEENASVENVPEADKRAFSVLMAILEGRWALRLMGCLAISGIGGIVVIWTSSSTVGAFIILVGWSLVALERAAQWIVLVEPEVTSRGLFMPKTEKGSPSLFWSKCQQACRAVRWIFWRWRERIPEQWRPYRGLLRSTFKSSNSPRKNE